MLKTFKINLQIKHKQTLFKTLNKQKSLQVPIVYNFFYIYLKDNFLFKPIAESGSGKTIRILTNPDSQILYTYILHRFPLKVAPPFATLKFCVIL